MFQKKNNCQFEINTKQDGFERDGYFMNLITCSENCEWQNDGCCKLDADAVIGAERINGCCYYKKPVGSECSAAAVIQLAVSS